MSAMTEGAGPTWQAPALLTTKLYIPPPRPGMICRLRLVERLDEALDLNKRLILISAPAGSGKTTLLAGWISELTSHPPVQVRQPRGQVGWLSLDEGDSDPVRFLGYLIASIQTLDAEVGEAISSALRSTRPPPFDSLLTGLANELAAALEAAPRDDSHWVIVLDDYHHVKAAPVHRAVAFLLDHAPPRFHLVVATRSDPPLPLARLRGRDQLAELREADMLFTASEAAAFLNGAMGLKLEADDLAALETRTEGWITGLQLAALSLRRQANEERSASIEAFSGSNRYILDYLAEEVLAREEAATQSFLLETSILSRLSGPLCAAVTGQEESQAVLERLERDNLFLVPLDDERHWYRYHRLFADLLRARLGRERAIALHRRASEWYERNGFVDEAIDHALAAGDHSVAAGLIEANAMEMLRRGELTILLWWLAALAGPEIRSRPWLSTYHAWALLLTGQPQEAESRLEDATAAASSTGTAADPVLLGHAAAIRAYAAAQAATLPEGRNVRRAIDLARQAQELLPEDEITVRSVVAFTLAATSLMTHDLAEASTALAEASRLGAQAGNVHVAVPALCSLARLQAQQGKLDVAETTYRQAQALVERHTKPGGRLLPVAASALAGQGELAYERNDLDRAEHLLRQSIELGKRWGNLEAWGGDCVTLARVLLARGDIQAALGVVREAEQHLRESGAEPRVLAQAAVVRARLALTATVDDLPSALDWVREARLKPDDEPGYLNLAEYLTQVRVLVAQGRRAPEDAMLDDARRLLGALGRFAREAGLEGIQIEILVLEALALQAQGRHGEAITALEQALLMAQPQGYVRAFVDEGRPMAELLLAIRQRSLSAHTGATLAWPAGQAGIGVGAANVERLLAAFPETDLPAGHRITAASPAVTPPLGLGPAPSLRTDLVEPLSERELQVLGLVAAGWTNQEIAEQLVIAITTVKSHTNHIYGKLQVRSRTEAVARAQALHLL